MKIAVISDIHGNVPALEAVLDDIEHWRPDELIVNGDLINRGPCSLEVMQLLRERAPRARHLKGNHETFVLECADNPRDPTHHGFDLYRFVHWTVKKLGSAIETVRGWSHYLDLDDLEGGAVHVTHGSRLGNRSGILPETSEDELAAKLGEPRDLFIASHTHRPLIRRFNGTLVVNTGSVGQPFDGDPRSAYGRFMFVKGRWRGEIARVSYNRTRALRDFIESGFLDEGGPLAGLIYHELQESRMHLGRWTRRYVNAVKAGEITVAKAVRAYLAQA